MNATLRSLAVLFVVLVALLSTVTAVGGVAAFSTTSNDLQQTPENASDGANASVTVVNQTRDGRSVFVDSATLPDGGFVVLRERGPGGGIVGVSLPLTPGTQEGKITLRGVPGAEANKTRLGANSTIVATIHRDTDGDGRFDGLLEPGTDAPYTENGTPVRDRANVTIPPEERPTTAAVNVTNSTTNGTNVTVDSVTLPAGGYVGIHGGTYNESNATDSAVGASRYLGPGTYENVTVGVGGGIPRENTTALTESGRISVVAYEDTDGDRRFQYVSSGGVEDRPYLENGTPVAASARLTVDRPPTPTASPTSTPSTTETGAPTPTTEPPTPAARDRTTAYGGESNGREGILDNPLFPVLVVVFAVFAVLVAVGGR